MLRSQYLKINPFQTFILGWDELSPNWPTFTSVVKGIQMIGSDAIW